MILRMFFKEQARTLQLNEIACILWKEASWWEDANCQLQKVRSQESEKQETCVFYVLTVIL